MLKYICLSITILIAVVAVLIYHYRNWRDCYALGSFRYFIPWPVLTVGVYFLEYCCMMIEKYANHASKSDIYVFKTTENIPLFQDMITSSLLVAIFVSTFIEIIISYSEKKDNRK